MAESAEPDFAKARFREYSVDKLASDFSSRAGNEKQHVFLPFLQGCPDGIG
jgi:hypothetical protein